MHLERLIKTYELLEKEIEPVPPRSGIKYIFVTGGVLSSVGKGTVSASIGLLLKERGYKVSIMKIDPYINVDAGTMNPYMHGEVFVTEDGGETDLDLGHYERFLGRNLTKYHNVTSGQVYLKVILDERFGKYLGKCVQVIPHITDEIKRRIRLVAAIDKPEILIVEIGGTVGDIEGLPFLEAARQMRLEEGFENVLFIHVALVPILETTGEQKTKPLQHSVHELRRIGIQPDIIVARCREPLLPEARDKIALYSNVPRKAVFTSYTVKSVYQVPLILEEQGITEYILKRLGLKERRKPDLSRWKEFVNALLNPVDYVKIAMVGKYVELKDAYISIIEALKHAAATLRIEPKLLWVRAEDLEKDSKEAYSMLEEAHGIVLLPGFGKRGAEGKIEAARFARENGKPFIGICFGMQLAVVEFARNVAGLEGANSTEIDPETRHPVIDLLPEQKKEVFLGGTMRLGAQEIHLVKGTIVHRIYGKEVIYERHRHRYEVNPKYIPLLEEKGLVFSGWDRERRRVEFIELQNHYFYVATQSHPEYKSRPLSPSPFYTAFVKAAYAYRKGEVSPYTGIEPR